MSRLADGAGVPFGVQCSSKGRRSLVQGSVGLAAHGGVDEQEGMGHAPSGACLHSRISQLARIQFALVPERIELRRNREGDR